MTGHVINFNPDGSADAMHNDAFPLSILGAQAITRATDIRFDQSRQKWAIWFPKPFPHVGGEYEEYRSATGFETYEGARQVEVEWLNRARLDGCHPTSIRGDAILSDVRKELGL